MKNCAEVVIIGGGVVGLSIAYHLGEMGYGDVVVLEKDHIGFGSVSYTHLTLPTTPYV